MKAEELIANLRACGPQELHVVFCYVSDCVHVAQLADGSKLRDASDFRQFLYELCAASKPKPEFFAHVTEGQAPAVSRTSPTVTARVDDDYCPRCGHVHQGRECGADIGGGRVCRCELEGVPA